VWSDDELSRLEGRKFEWIKMLHDLGHGKRYWDDVKVGDALPTRVFGPHSERPIWRFALFAFRKRLHGLILQTHFGAARRRRFSARPLFLQPKSRYGSGVSFLSIASRLSAS
jgi:hypothetical protein